MEIYGFWWKATELIVSAKLSRKTWNQALIPLLFFLRRCSEVCVGVTCSFSTKCHPIISLMLPAEEVLTWRRRGRPLCQSKSLVGSAHHHHHPNLFICLNGRAVWLFSRQEDGPLRASLTFSEERPLVLRMLHRSAAKPRCLTWSSPLLSRTLSLFNCYSWRQLSCFLVGAEETVKNDCPVLFCHCWKGQVNQNQQNDKNLFILRTLYGSHYVFFFIVPPVILH